MVRPPKVRERKAGLPPRRQRFPLHRVSHLPEPSLSRRHRNNFLKLRAITTHPPRRPRSRAGRSTTVPWERTNHRIRSHKNTPLPRIPSVRSTTSKKADSPGKTRHKSRLTKWRFPQKLRCCSHRQTRPLRLPQTMPTSILWKSMPNACRSRCRANA